ncbi:MAG: peptide deformylase [Patescibacteria group bacterium]
MSFLEILTNPNDNLREKSRLVSDEEIKSKEIQTLIDDMFETMKKANGVGLAAPQVDQRLQIIIVETKEGPQAFINPKIVSRSRHMTIGEEGCLSIPGYYGMVQRHTKVKVRAKNRQGEVVSMICDELPAVIFQHEIDHLDGILFIDRAESLHDITPEIEDRLI